MTFCISSCSLDPCIIIIIAIVIFSATCIYNVLKKKKKEVIYSSSFYWGGTSFLYILLLRMYSKHCSVYCWGSVKVCLKAHHHWLICVIKWGVPSALPEDLASLSKLVPRSGLCSCSLEGLLLHGSGREIGHCVSCERPQVGFRSSLLVSDDSGDGERSLRYRAMTVPNVAGQRTASRTRTLSCVESPGVLHGQHVPRAGSDWRPKKRENAQDLVTKEECHNSCGILWSTSMHREGRLERD